MSEWAGPAVENSRGKVPNVVTDSSAEIKTVDGTAYKLKG